MYDELVKALRETDFSDGCPCGADPMCKDKDCVIWQAADAIEEMQAGEKKFLRIISALEMENENLKRARRWIPVTERLPEKRKWVLCRCEANIIEVLRWENNEWYHDPMHVYYPSFVTHWQPLPEPPKEET